MSLLRGALGKSALAHLLDACADADQRHSLPIFDSERRLVIACVAPPGANAVDQGADYLRCIREATQQLRVLNIAFPEYFIEISEGRRGVYNCVHAGISMGGGQMVPLSHLVSFLQANWILIHISDHKIYTCQSFYDMQ